MRPSSGVSSPQRRAARPTLDAAGGAPAPVRPAARLSMERETGFEPATPSLEGWRSTAELFPPVNPLATSHDNRSKLVGRGGFEPPKAYASRFTVCPLWP